MLVASIIVSSISQILLIFFVFFKGRRNLTNLLFALIGAASLAWALSSYLSIVLLHTESILSVVRLILFCVVIQNTLFLLFAKTFPGTKWDYSKRWLGAYLTISAIVALATLSPFVFAGVSATALTAVTHTGPGMLLFVAHASYSIFFAFKHLITKFRKASGSRREQLRILLIASVLVWVVVPITNFAVTPLLQTTFFVEKSPIYTFLFNCIIAYAIIKHRLFDIKLAAVRTAAYILSILTLSSIYYFIAYIVSVLIFGGRVSSTVSISPVNIALALVLAFVFQPIKHFFDKITDSIFYWQQYRVDDFYAQLSETLTTTTDLRGLLERAAREIGNTLKAEQAFFYVQWNHTHHVSAGTKDHKLLPPADAHTLNEYVEKNGDAVIVTELLAENSQIRRLLLSHRIAVLMPLVRKGGAIGYLALGDHQSGGYTNRDIKVLSTASDELIIAIQNALNVQEVKDINTHLEQRIDAATKELKTKNTQLRHLDATKDEFLSMASHQLRTPLTSVKGYLSMVLEGDAGKISDSQKHLLGEAFTSSERMVHLIHDFLNVSRLQTGKFVIESKPVDLVKLVEAEVKSLKQVAGARNMQLEYAHSDNIPMLSLDETKMQQVVMNYIDNALYYSRPESPVVKIDLKRAGDDVELRVIDGGIGVPESEKEKLFEKFFRAGNARQKRPDGTGVGIYLAKKVIDATGGEIIFDSEVGKGSTFGFRLPIEKLKVSDKESN